MTQHSQCTRYAGTGTSCAQKYSPPTHAWYQGTSIRYQYQCCTRYPGTGTTTGTPVRGTRYPW